MRAARGFSLLELTIVLALMGLIASIAVPRLTRRSPVDAWPAVVDMLNDCVAFARSEAIVTQQPYAVSFYRGRDGANDFVAIEHLVSDSENPDRKNFQQASSPYFTTRREFSSRIKITSVFLGKEDLLAEQGGVGRFFVIPDGLVQEVCIYLTRREDGAKSEVSLRMQPYLGFFELADGFVRPGRA